MKRILYALSIIFVCATSAPMAKAAFPVATTSQTALPAGVSGTESGIFIAPTHSGTNAPVPTNDFKRIQRNNEAIGYSIASVACAVVGLIVAALPLGIAAVVFGIIGLSKGLRGLAIAGIILGAIDIIAGIIIIALALSTL